MEIGNSYLQWVGAEHYPTIDDFVKEALEKGVSKRVNHKGVASALLEPDTVVFLAHDEGEYEDCEVCKGIIECPECRKRETLVNRIKGQIEDVKKERKSILYADNFDPSDHDTNKKLMSVNRKIEKREKKIDNLNEDCNSCILCEGSGEAVLGSGGAVQFNDGTIMDYRQFMWYKRQPSSGLSNEGDETTNANRYSFTMQHAP